MCFICVDDVEWEELDWGDLGWVMRPANVLEGSQLCALDVNLNPGKGHDFHRHPNYAPGTLIATEAGPMMELPSDENNELLLAAAPTMAGDPLSLTEPVEGGVA